MKTTLTTWANGEVNICICTDQRNWERLKSSLIWKRLENFLDGQASDLESIDTLEPSSTHSLFIDTSRHLYMLDGKKLQRVFSIDAHIDYQNLQASIVYDLT